MPVLEREKRGSDAFRINYENNVSDRVLYEDVVSYLGEYRFRVPEYSYNLKFLDGKLIDPNRNESMEEAAQRAIDLRIKEGRSYDREMAEKMGFQSLNRQLQSFKSGDTIFWASPPGPKEDGYGDYGFIYYGQIKEDGLGGKNIKMNAMRLNNPNISQFRDAMRILTDEDASYTAAGGFLANPRVKNKEIAQKHVDLVLKTVFGFESNEKEQEKFRNIIQQMMPLILEFALNPKRRIEDLYVLENFALKLKDDYERREKHNIIEIVDFSRSQTIREMQGDYGHAPPKVLGSCGSTSSSAKSNNVFNSISSLLEDQYGSRTFECPSCKKKNIRSKDELIESCQHCGEDVRC